MLFGKGILKGILWRSWLLSFVCGSRVRMGTLDSLGTRTGWCIVFRKTKSIQQHVGNPITLKTNRKTQRPMRCWEQCAVTKACLELPIGLTRLHPSAVISPPGAREQAALEPFTPPRTSPRFCTACHHSSSLHNIASPGFKPH